MGYRFRLCFFAAAALAAAGFGAAQESGNAVARFDQIGEVVENWSKDRHLWIKGRLPVSDRHLNELGGWLGEHFPNWTAVLMQNARGQSFEDYRGMDAVEHALGKQLANRTGFGNLKDSRTGESNGAFFILFLDERKFSYYASDAFDKRGLGETRWVGHLDKPAIAAMRGGGRIADAVRDTVTNIEQQLTGRIKAEAAAKKRAAIERERAIEEARQLPGMLDAEIARIEKTVRDYRNTRRLPESADPSPANLRQLSGDLFELPLPSWKAAVKAIEDHATAEDVAGARELYDRSLGEIRRFSRDIDRWREDGKKGIDLANRLSAVQTGLTRVEEGADDAAGQGLIARASEALNSGIENHALGESLYREQYETAERTIERADARITSLETAAADRARREKFRKLVTSFTIMAGVVAFFVVLIILNRLRAPAKKEALNALREWQGKLQGKFDQLFALMDRASVIVGPSVELENRGFSGTTLDLCRETIREVDELFIMSSATDSVIDRVEKLVDTDSIGGGIVNGFSSRRYRKAIALLGSQPIGFDREQGLRAILEPTRKVNPEVAGRSLLGNPEDYEPFRMSFEELIAAYDEKQEAAIATVDRLEHCIDGLPLLLDELGIRFNEVKSMSATLAEATEKDGFFPAENLRTDLLPAASANLESAAENGRADPVTAMESPATDAKRQLEAGHRLATRLVAARRRDFAKVEESAGELEAIGRNVSWIDRYYAEATNQAEQLSKVMVDREVDDDLGEFEDDLLRIRGRAANCAKLARRAEEEIAAAIEEAVDLARRTRKELAGELSLSPQDVLAEEDLSPFVKIESARKELDAARAALDRGNVEAAQEDFAGIERSLDESADLLELSREVAGSHGERHDTLAKTLRKTREQEPETAALLDELVDRYDPAVLLFSSRTGGRAGGQDSIGESINRARERMNSATKVLEKSSATFAAGHLIASGSLLERAGNEIGFARHQLSLVEDQHAALKKAESENTGELAELKRRHQALADDVADRRTMIPTLDHHRTAGDRLTAIGRDLAADRPDPFAAALALEAQASELNGIEDGIESDRTLFATAEASVVDAKRKLSESAEVVHEARTDQIPDSPKLKSGIRRHHQLEEWLAGLERSLEEPHGDWPAVQEASFAGIDEILKAKNLMESELRAAQAAAEQLRQASAFLSDLQSWRSRHRVRFDRQAGLGAFGSARDALARGDYAAAQQFARSARDDARWELSSARSEERRRKAEAEAERRRKQQQSMFSSGSSFGSNSGGGISFGGGGSSFGGSSGGSGFSSGSFSSGSGVSRSGW